MNIFKETIWNLVELNDRLFTWVKKSNKEGRARETWLSTNGASEAMKFPTLDVLLDHMTIRQKG